MIKILTIILLLAGCGTDDRNIRTTERGERGQDGTTCAVQDHEDGAIIQCDDGTEEIIYDGTDAEQPANIDMSGYWLLPNGGYIELLLTDDNRYIIYGAQRIYSENFDGELALHPTIPSGPHYLRADKILGEYSANYDRNTNDVEVDDDTRNIHGRRKTFYMLTLVDNQLQIDITIYNRNGLAIEVSRSIKSL